MKAGRNEPCPCGSGRKFKQCHGAAGTVAVAAPTPQRHGMPSMQKGPTLQEHGIQLLQQGRAAEAARCFRQALAAKAGNAGQAAATLHAQLGLALMLMGHADEAEASLRRALALNDRLAGACANLGAVLKMQERPAEAEAALRRALALDDTIAAAHSNLGTLLMKRHEGPAAAAAFQRALALDPAFADAHFNQASLLREQGHIAASITALRRVITLNPQHLPAWHNLLLSQLYADDAAAAEVLAWHRRFDTLLGMVGVAPTAPRPMARGPERRLRVGLLSPDLRRHSVALFLLPLLQHHARDRLEFVAYHDSPVHDVMSDTLRAQVAQWHAVHALPDETLAERIRADGVDVLVDLAGHTGLRLPVFARRAAPLQLTWLGYPASTGLGEIDGRLSDVQSDPAAHDALHSERVWRLPDSYFCYAPPPGAPEPAELPLQVSGTPTFGSFNAVPKLSAATLALWARVLHAVPGSRLVLKAAGLADADAAARIIGTLARHGIEAERLTLLAWRAETASHLDAYATIDVALDPTPYNGATTTCEALWMGVPVVTLAGDRPQARMGASVLHAAGCSTWVAADEDAYIAAAVALVSDVPALAAWRRGARSTLAQSRLLDGPRFAAAWEATVREAWRMACQAGG